MGRVSGLLSGGYNAQRTRGECATLVVASPQIVKTVAVASGRVDKLQPRNRRHGRSRDPSENYSPMDGASEGPATDGRSGGGLRQKGRRAKQVSAQQSRAVRQNHGMAIVARREVVTGPPGRSDSSESVPLARSVDLMWYMRLDESWT